MSLPVETFSGTPETIEIPQTAKCYAGREVCVSTFAADPRLRGFEMPDREDPPQLFIANGWGTGIETMSGPAKAFAQDGVLTHVLTNDRLKEARQDPENFKLENLEAVVEQCSLDQPFQLLGYSEGGITATRLASRLLEDGNDKLQGLTLVAPAGLVGKERQTELLWRASKEFAQMPSRGYLRSLGAAALRGIRYAFKDPQLSLYEARDIAQTELLPQIKTLGEAGIPVNIVLCDEDIIFPLQRVRMQMEAAELPPSVKVAELPGAHTELVTSANFQQEVGGLLIPRAATIEPYARTS